MSSRKPCLAVVAFALLVSARAATGWGVTGHAATNRLAADALPDSAPAWLRRATRGLEHLGYEPDRWRHGDLAPMDRALAPDHYINVEFTGDLAKLPEDRWAYFRLLLERQQQGLIPPKLPPQIVGFAPYRATELAQQLEAQVAALELTPPATPAAREAEEACVLTAGLLGHFVADLANPHHTTRHYDGWRGDNPRGYRTREGFHSEFEELFVDRVYDRKRAFELMTPVEEVDSYWATIVAHLKRSNGLVERLYELEKRGGIPRVAEKDLARHRPNDAEREAVDFLHHRLAAGASVLRDLWVTAVKRGKERADRMRCARRLNEELEKLGLFGDDAGVGHRPPRTLILQGEVEDDETRVKVLPIAIEIAERLRLRVTVLSELTAKGATGPF